MNINKLKKSHDVIRLYDSQKQLKILTNRNNVLENQNKSLKEYVKVLENKSNHLNYLTKLLIILFCMICIFYFPF